MYRNAQNSIICNSPKLETCIRSPRLLELGFCKPCFFVSLVSFEARPVGGARRGRQGGRRVGTGVLQLASSACSGTWSILMATTALYLGSRARFEFPAFSPSQNQPLLCRWNTQHHCPVLFLWVPLPSGSSSKLWMPVTPTSSLC